MNTYWRAEMVKPSLKIVEDEKKEDAIGFRAKVWNVCVNVIGYVLTVGVMFIDIAIVVPIGFAAGIVLNKYPNWAILPLSMRLLPYMPADGEKWNTRPFYRRR